MGRASFTAKVKKDAAKKVSYFCSYPGCNRITIGSKGNNDEWTTVGEAAHIYPASVNGPRYNKSITVDFLKSEENCLWLCNNHHALIDKDVESHSAEILFKWKKDAEQLSNELLKKSTISFDNIQRNELNVVFLEEIFNKYIIDGNIVELLILLEKFEQEINIDDYMQLFSYFKIKAFYYNNPDLVESELSYFLRLKNNEYINKIIEFFIENLDIYLLNKLNVEITSEYTKYYEAIKNKNIIGEVIKVVYPNDSSESPEILKKKFILEQKEDDVFVEKFISNFIFFNIKDQNVPKYNPYNMEGHLYDDEFIYKMRSFIYELNSKISKNVDILKSDIFDTIEFIWLKNAEDKIKNYNVDFQKPYWHLMTSIMSQKIDINKLLDNIPSELVNDFEFVALKMFDNIKKDLKKVNLEELINLSIEQDNFELLLHYINFLNPKDKKTLFENYEEIVKLDSRILAIWAEIYMFEESLITLDGFVEKFNKIFNNDVLYILIVMRYKISKKIDYTEEKTLLDNMLKTGTGFEFFSLNYFIEVLRISNNKGMLKRLLHRDIEVNIKLKVAKLLLLINDTNINEKVKVILDDIRQSTNNNAFLLNCLGLYYFQKGIKDKALEYYEKSYDLDRNSALDYLSAKHQLSAPFTQEELLHCESSNDVYLLELLILQYMSIGEIDKAKEIFVYYFSFNIDTQNKEAMLLKYFDLISRYPKLVSDSKYVDKDYTVVLTQSSNSINISIHNRQSIRENSGAYFLNTLNYSEKDKDISEIMYKKIDDEVEFLNEKYVITSIVPLERHFSNELINILHGDGTNTAFQVLNYENMNEAIEKITEVVIKSHTQQEEIIKHYNENTILPVGLFAKQRSKGIIETMEFLIYNNDSKIKANINSFIGGKLLVSYDTLIQLFIINDEYKVSLEEYEIYTTRSIFEKFKSEIENEMFSLKSNNSTGFLTVYENKMAYVENTKENKAKRKIYLNKFMRFLEKINIIDNPVNVKENLFNQFLIDNDLKMEKEIISALEGDEDLLLITDNIFFIVISYFSRFKNVGIYELLKRSSLNKEEQLQVLLKLNYELPKL